MNFSEITHQDLLRQTRDLAAQERQCIVDLLVYLREVAARKLFLLLGYGSLAQYAIAELGFSHDAAWKRAQVVRIIGPYPIFLEMIRSSATSVSSVAALAAKITPANAEQIIEFLPHKSKRAVEAFLSTLLPDGTRLDKEPEVEISFKGSKRLADKLDEARGLLVKGKQAPKLAAVIEQAIDLLPDQKHPLRKAERAAKRKVSAKVARPGAAEAENAARMKKSRYIPARVRHAVVLRDGGACNYVGSSGIRCGQGAMLQFDHRTMYCRGGEHSIENLRLLCATHNALVADRELGRFRLTETG